MACPLALHHHLYTLAFFLVLYIPERKEMVIYFLNGQAAEQTCSRAGVGTLVILHVHALINFTYYDYVSPL